MSDRYLNLVNSPVGSAVAERVGLPRPAKLRRYSAGDPLLPGPALVGATAGKAPAALKRMLTAAGVEVTESLGDGDRIAAAVLDARSIATPGDLGAVREFLAPAVKALGPSGRVLVLGRPADGADISADATRQALDGIVRSLAKEQRRGATANLLWVADEASLPSALRFFLSGHSAYVDGQPLLLGPGVAPAPEGLGPAAGRQDRAGHRRRPRHRRRDRRGSWPATAPTSSSPTSPRPARRWPRSRTGSVARRCTWTSPRPRPPSGCSTTWPPTAPAWTS